MPLRGARRDAITRQLRAAVRRPRDQPRLDAQRARHRHRDAGLWSVTNPSGTSSNGAKQLTTTSPARRRWSPAARPDRAPTRTTSTAARRRSAAGRSACPRTPRRTARSRSATTSPTGATPRPDDSLRVIVEAEDGTPTVVFEELGAGNDDDARVVVRLALARRLGGPDDPDRGRGHRRRGRQPRRGRHRRPAHPPALAAPGAGLAPPSLRGWNVRPRRRHAPVAGHRRSCAHARADRPRHPAGVGRRRGARRALGDRAGPCLDPAPGARPDPDRAQRGPRVAGGLRRVVRARPRR